MCIEVFGIGTAYQFDYYKNINYAKTPALKHNLFISQKKQMLNKFCSAHTWIVLVSCFDWCLALNTIINIVHKWYWIHLTGLLVMGYWIR